VGRDIIEAVRHIEGVAAVGTSWADYRAKRFITFSPDRCAECTARKRRNIMP
jgi:hypothetical protein